MSLIKEFIEYWAQFLLIYYAKQEKISVETQTIYNNPIEHIPKKEHHIYNGVGGFNFYEHIAS